METSEQRSTDTAERYDLSNGESISTGVVMAIAAASDAEPVPTADTTEGTPVLEPLYTVVDPDALDALFEADGSGTAGPKRVTFSYHGYEVTVTEGRQVCLERLERPAGDVAE